MCFCVVLFRLVVLCKSLLGIGKGIRRGSNNYSHHWHFIPEIHLRGVGRDVQLYLMSEQALFNDLGLKNSYKIA